MPHLATFAVDDGFSYRIPDTLGDVEVGSLVRIPLGGRRTRGFVTHLRDGPDPGNLRDILGVVGGLPVFTPRLLSTLRWASIHYVAPLSVMLATAAPPNAPRRPTGSGSVSARSGSGPGYDSGPDSPLPDVTRASVDGRHTRAHYAVGGGGWADWLAALAGDVLDAGRNVAVVVPTVAEATRLAEDLAPLLGGAPLLANSSEKAADVTRVWSTLQTGGGRMVVGTREVALWPLGDPGLMVVMEEGRPAMKAPQTPTLAVRDVVRRRSGAERFALVFAGPVPTVEALATGMEVTEPATRVWPLVEVVDRSEEPPGRGVIMEGTVRAIQGAMRSGGEVFVFVTRRGDAAAFRCVDCGTLRTCAACGAGASRSDVCARCAAPLGACTQCGAMRFQALGASIGTVISELRRSLGDAVGGADGPGPVRVGTERDIPAIQGRPGNTVLAVVVDADTLLLAPHYRAEEDALRTMARTALTVVRGRGRRCLVQTGQPRHRVFEALRNGRPTALLRTILEERSRAGFPPVTQLMAVEVTGAAPGADDDLRSVAGGAAIHGPAPSGDATRWLVSGSDLRPVKVLLRGQVQKWRDSGAKVRIDADPVRL